MKFDYLYDDSQKSLAPFFSGKMLSITFNSVWILVLILLIWTPRKALHVYVSEQEIPLNFFVIFGVTLLMNAYVSLRCGRGEIFEGLILVRPERERLPTLEEERPFFSYGLVEFFLHTLFLLMILLPLLLVSAAISEISPGVLIKSLTIIFGASLLCRLFGFLMFLSLRNWPRTGYHLSRLFFYIFIVGTGFFAPYTNPLLTIYGFSMGREMSSPFQIEAYWLYILIIGLAILILILANQMMVRQNILKGKSN